MISKKLILVALAATLTAAASAQVTFLGQLDLHYVGEAPGGDGTFEWTDQFSDTLFTYCFSTNNFFDPGVNPQIFNVYSVGDATLPTNPTLGALVASNNMTGLTAQHFLDAMTDAEFFGPAGITQTDADNNATIHHDEQFGGTHGTNINSNTFWYLQQDNPGSYTYAGQPQALVFNGTGPHHPAPTPEPITMALSIAGLGIAIRRGVAKRKA